MSGYKKWLHTVNFSISQTYYRDNSLSDNSHHSFLVSQCVMAYSTALTTFPVCRKSGSICWSSMYCCQNQNFTPTSKHGAGRELFQVAHVTSNEHAVHCTSKCYKISEPTGSDYDSCRIGTLSLTHECTVHMQVLWDRGRKRKRIHTQNMAELQFLYQTIKTLIM